MLGVPPYRTFLGTSSGGGSTSPTPPGLRRGPAGSRQHEQGEGAGLAPCVWPWVCPEQSSAAGGSACVADLSMTCHLIEVLFSCLTKPVDFWGVCWVTAGAGGQMSPVCPVKWKHRVLLRAPGSQRPRGVATRGLGLHEGALALSGLICYNCKGVVARSSIQMLIRPLNCHSR